MATANNSTFENLNARAHALGLELICDGDDYAEPDAIEYYLLDCERRTLVAGNLGSPESIEIELRDRELNADDSAYGDLRRRVAALGLELWVDGDRQLVLAHGKDGGEPTIEFVHRNAGDDELVDWLESREASILYRAVSKQLKTADDGGNDSDDDAPGKPVVTIFDGDVVQIVEGVVGIANAFDRQELDLETGCLVSALSRLSDELYKALGDTPRPVIKALGDIVDIRE